MADHLLPLTPAPRRIAAFRALFLGDLLCSLPAFRALRHAFPQAEITLIGLPWAAEFVEHTHYIDRLEVFPGYRGIMEVPYRPEQTDAFLAAAHATPYDLALQMHGDGHVSNGFVADLGARVSLGYRRGADDRLRLSLPYDPDEHEVLRWLRLVALLGIPAAETGIDFPTTPAEQQEAAVLLGVPPLTPPEWVGSRGGVAPLVGLHPGAKEAIRRWPAERFAELGDELVERYGAHIVLTGGDGDREITAAVRRAMRHPALDLAGQTSLGAFAAVLQRLQLLVTNDTGASHLAAATQTPTVVLFGPSRPEQWAPLDRDRHRVVDALALAGPGDDPAAALGRLPVAPVLGVCTEVLGRTNDQRPAKGTGDSGQGTGDKVHRPPVSPVPCSLSPNRGRRSARKEA